MVSVRVLTLMFMRAHLNDPAWFQTGSYAKFDRQARDILDGRPATFPDRRSDAHGSRAVSTAFPRVRGGDLRRDGERSAYAVQTCQWAIDLVLSLY
jgi:hypothetical protein